MFKNLFMSIFVILYNILGKIILVRFMKKINEVIKDFREDNDLSQSEVAKYLKIPRSTYGHYETGNSKIPIEIIIQLSEFYNVTPNDFLGFSNSSTLTDISKTKKLCRFIKSENINIDKLIEIMKLIKNINN